MPGTSGPITSIIFPPQDAVADEDQGDQGEWGDGGGREAGREGRGQRGKAFGGRGVAAGASDSLGLKRMLTASHDQTVRMWDLVHLAEIDAQAHM